MAEPAQEDLRDRDSAAAGTQSEEDLYAALGVPKTATAEEIKSSYRRLALRLHPDKNAGGEEAKRRFQEVALAYQVRACSSPPPPGPPLRRASRTRLQSSRPG
jgi:DnaJ-domain-containing protein 1